MSWDQRQVIALLDAASPGGSCRRAIRPVSLGLHRKMSTFAVLESVEFVNPVREAKLSYELLNFFQFVSQLALNDQNPIIL